MIEARYWKEDLLKYAKNFRPVKNPPRWSEKLQVDFEKEVIIAFFMIRKLFEAQKISSTTMNYLPTIYRYSYMAKQIHFLNYWKIEELYKLEDEEQVNHYIYL